MLEGFICPDGQTIKIEECLKSCRVGRRCMTLPSLVLISREREWTGRGSTTQLIVGTMEAFLKLTKPYYVSPDKRAFMLGGTRHHQSLEAVAKELGLASELALSVDRDIIDLLEWEGNDLVLTDYKLWGSFKLVKALGLVEVGKIPDPSGEVYKTTTKWGKAGSVKLVPVFAQDPSKVDNWEAEYQLNHYKVKATPLLEKVGLKIARMQLQVTVRDGGLYVAKDRGITKNVYMIDIPEIPEEVILGYFIFKQDCLAKALEDGSWLLPCTVKESWEGNKCEDWCEVWNYCPKGKLVHNIGG